MRPAGGFSGLLAALAAAGGLGLFPVGGSVTARAAQASQQARPLPGFGNPDGHADVPAAGRAVNTSHPTQVIGTGTPGSCTPLPSWGQWPRAASSPLTAAPGRSPSR